MASEREDYAALIGANPKAVQARLNQRAGKAAQLAVADLFTAAGLEVVWFSQPGIPRGRGRSRGTFQTPGIPDMRVYWRARRFAFWFEVKSGRARLSASQRSFRERAREVGEAYYEGDPEAARQLLRGWRLLQPDPNLPGLEVLHPARR